MHFREGTDGQARPFAGVTVTIGLVGPCAAGKSTLAQRLKALGYEVRQIAQEHSYVPDMWRRISNPDVLIYLDVSFPVSMARRPMPWDEADFEEQKRRLEHARAHADLIVQTDRLTPEEVLTQVLDYLRHLGLSPSNLPSPSGKDKR